MVEILHLFENMYKIGQHSDFYPTWLRIPSFVSAAIEQVEVKFNV
jgi:hypothetical protein